MPLPNLFIVAVVIELLLTVCEINICSLVFGFSLEVSNKGLHTL